MRSGDAARLKVSVTQKIRVMKEQQVERSCSTAKTNMILQDHHKTIISCFFPDRELHCYRFDSVCKIKLNLPRIRKRIYNVGSSVLRILK